MAKPNPCATLEGSVGWCQGRTSLPGIRRRLYYISKSKVLNFPDLMRDENGNILAPVYKDEITIAADAVWHYIDLLPDKCQLTSDAQGEVPSQSQLNKLTAVHPGVDERATMIASYINNNDCLFIVEDMEGRGRLLGNDRYTTKATVAQDLGQGPTGTTSTTISVEVTDAVPAPFVRSTILTEDGEVSFKDPLDAFDFSNDKDA